MTTFAAEICHSEQSEESWLDFPISSPRGVSQLSTLSFRSHFAAPASIWRRKVAATRNGAEKRAGLACGFFWWLRPVVFVHVPQIDVAEAEGTPPGVHHRRIEAPHAVASHSLFADRSGVGNERADFVFLKERVGPYPPSFLLSLGATVVCNDENEQVREDLLEDFTDSQGIHCRRPHFENEEIGRGRHHRRNHARVVLSFAAYSKVSLRQESLAKLLAKHFVAESEKYADHSSIRLWEPPTSDCEEDFEHSLRDLLWAVTAENNSSSKETRRSGLRANPRRKKDTRLTSGHRSQDTHRAQAGSAADFDCSRRGRPQNDMRDSRKSRIAATHLPSDAVIAHATLHALLVVAFLDAKGWIGQRSPELPNLAKSRPRLQRELQCYSVICPDSPRAPCRVQRPIELRIS